MAARHHRRGVGELDHWRHLGALERHLFHHDYSRLRATPVFSGIRPHRLWWRRWHDTGRALVLWLFTQPQQSSRDVLRDFVGPSVVLAVRATLRNLATLYRYCRHQIE